MNAKTLLSLVNELKIHIYSNNNKISVKGDNQTLSTILPIIRLYKNSLHQHFDNVDIYADLFEERAGILEFDNGLSKKDAELQALNELLVKYSNDNGLDIGSEKSNIFIISLMKKVKPIIWQS